LFCWYRVVTLGTEKEIAGHRFTGFGAHYSNYLCTYLTAAAALGITKSDVDNFIRRLDKVFVKKMTATDEAVNVMSLLTVNGSEASTVSDSQDDKQLDDASSQTASTADWDLTDASLLSFGSRAPTGILAGGVYIFPFFSIPSPCLSILLLPSPSLLLCPLCPFVFAAKRIP